MDAPQNYTIQTESPFTAGLKGYQAGAAIRDDQIAAQQKQQAFDLQQRQSAAIQEVMNKANPTSSDFARLTTLIPSMGAHFKQASDMLNADQQRNTVGLLSQSFSALNTGRADVAVATIKAQADAMKEANPAKSQELMTLANMVEQNPALGKTLIGARISATDGGDKLLDNLLKLQKAPGELRKLNAEATVAETDAGNAPTKAALSNADTESTIQKRADDTRIAELNTQIGQANSETQRGQLVLERDKLVGEQQKKAQTAGSGTQDALDSANNLLRQIEGVDKHPGLTTGTGTLGGFFSFFNSSNANDFRKAVEGLKSPVFLNELGKLKEAGISLGQVTEVEGKKLEQRIANLDTDQSTPAFRNQVNVLRKDVEKFIRKIVAGGQLPTTGGAFLGTSSQFGKVYEGQVNKLLKDNPGSTRAQALQYLGIKE